MAVHSLALVETCASGVPLHSVSEAEQPTRESAPDVALLALIAEGDQQAFRLFYDRYGGKILAYVRRHSRDSGAEEDVVQEIFVQVWRKAATYRPSRGAVAGWLYTITRNRMVDRWRRTSARVQGDESELDRLVASDRGADGQVVDLTVRQALSHLTAEQRQAVEMAYFGGLTYEETAERLGLPLGTLKSRIRVALMRMRSVLEAVENN